MMRRDNLYTDYRSKDDSEKHKGVGVVGKLGNASNQSNANVYIHIYRCKSICWYYLDTDINVRIGYRYLTSKL